MTTLGISRIGQIAINCNNVDRATAFYRDVLGLKFLFSAGPLSFFDCGGVRLMLSHPDRPDLDHPSSIIYLVVTDIHTSHQQLLTGKVKVEETPHLIAKMPDHDLWMTSFRDSEQNLLVLMSEVKHAS